MRYIPRVMLPSLISIVIGILSHIIFYPVLENWTNIRNRKLGRPSIGVTVNYFPFLIHLAMMLNGGDLPRTRLKVLLYGSASYMLSFGWNAIGVVIGYMITDWRDKNSRRK